MPRVYNKNSDTIPESAVYIGRPSKFGNPFVVGEHGTRKTVIRKYKKWLAEQPSLVADIRKELRGKDLVCWCYPLTCHGDILLTVANQSTLFDDL